MKMSQAHFGVLYSANQDSLTAMLMRAFEEIDALIDKCNEFSEIADQQTKAALQLNDELAQALSDNEYLRNRINTLSGKE